MPGDRRKGGLLASGPGVFFTTLHDDGHLTLLVDLAAIGTEELTELIVGSWRDRAPERVRAAHGGAHPFAG